MMKKRIVSLGLAAMMTAGLFAGCGNSSESQGDSTASGDVYKRQVPDRLADRGNGKTDGNPAADLPVCRKETFTGSSDSIKTQYADRECDFAFLQPFG